MYPLTRHSAVFWLNTLARAKQGDKNELNLLRVENMLRQEHSQPTVEEESLITYLFKKNYIRVIIILSIYLKAQHIIVIIVMIIKYEEIMDTLSNVIDNLINQNRSFEVPKNTFNCPICDRESNINEASIEQVTTSSKHIGTKIRGRVVTRTYRDTYYNVRICPKCNKRKIKVDRIILGFVLIVLPTLYSIFYFVNSDNNGIVNFILLMVLPIPLALLFIYIILSKIINALFFDIKIKKAEENNAILKNTFWL